MDVGDYVGVVSAVVAVTSVVWAYRGDKRAKKKQESDDIHQDTGERRAAVAEALAVSKATVEGFEKQNELLREQLTALKKVNEDNEAAWRKREKTWNQKEAKLESRLHAVENGNKAILLKITEMGLCPEFKTCAIYQGLIVAFAETVEKGES